MGIDNDCLGVLGELEIACLPLYRMEIQNALRRLSKGDGEETKMRYLDLIQHVNNIGERIGLDSMRKELGSKVAKYLVDLIDLYTDKYPRISDIIVKRDGKSIDTRGIKSIYAILFTGMVFNLDWDYKLAVPGNMSPKYALQEVFP